MSLGIAFWLVFILYIILSVFLAWPGTRAGWVSFALQAILFFLIGWGLFGAIVSD